MKGDIAKKMLVLLTGITLAQLTKAETDLGFRLTSSTMIGFAMHGHILAKAVLAVTYER